MAAAEEEKPKLRIIIKKKGGHGHHGGAWKVAYADFVTAMMALFIVLWLLSVADPKTKKDIARYFRDPGFLQGGSAMIVPGDDGGQSGKPAVMQSAPAAELAKRAAQAEEAALQKEARALSNVLDRAASESSEMADLRKQVIVTVNPEGLQIQFVDKDGDHDLLFNLSSAELKPAMIALLKRMSVTLAKIDNPLVIGGHTDARVFARGAGKDNWDLSYERAAAARRVLEVGALQGRVHRVTAYGSSEPFNPKDPMAPENRRLSIVALRHSKVVAGPDDKLTPPGDKPGAEAPASATEVARSGAGGKESARNEVTADSPPKEIARAAVAAANPAKDAVRAVMAEVSPLEKTAHAGEGHDVAAAKEAQEAPAKAAPVAPAKAEAPSKAEAPAKAAPSAHAK